jgi:hypothetical protein
VGNAIKTADSQAFKTVYLTSIAFGGLSILAALFAQNIDEKLTDQVARKFRGTEKIEAKELVGAEQSGNRKGEGSEKLSV